MLKRGVIRINFTFRQALKNKKRLASSLFWISCSSTLVLYLLLRWNNDPLAIEQHFIFIEPLRSYWRFQHPRATKDWHDYNTIEAESLRTGPGEQGQPVYVSKDEEELSQKIFEENHHNGLVSDKIARDRAVPDTRPAECKKRNYLVELPTVSVVIPFHNEHLSTLTRTVHSVLNRSPSELLLEVILVNDHSDKEHCYGELEEYIRNHFDVRRIRLLVMPVRSGLMWARLAGARAAVGDVIVFMDCHTEANVNWLPPLIEPIAKNYKTCTVPITDVINAKTYKYERIDHGSRGTFDWTFTFQGLPARPEDHESEDAPFQTPVMMGCVFAISSKFFWELGGYDTGLDIWGGEQYELSFKVWLCGGQQLDVPCSRVAHLYRPRPHGSAHVEDKKDYCTKNFKRVAEVWMDDYKQFVYDRNPKRWNEADAGDVSYMMGIKRKLNCKPFKYFMEEVAPDMLDKYPTVEPPPFALGGIESDAAPKLCIDTLGVPRENPVGLYSCKEKLENPGYRQTFRLRIHRDISVENSDSECLDINRGKVLLYKCKFKQDNQYFRYDIDTKQIYCGSKRSNQCIDMDPKLKNLFVSTCHPGKVTQKWTWGFVNETMLRNWVDFGKKILDETEINDLRNS